MWRSLRSWFERASAAAVGAVCLVLVAFVGLLDHLTGVELSFSIFYLAPVALAAWYGKRLVATAIALLSALIWFIVDFESGHVYSNQLIPVWNTAVRLGFFLITEQLVSAVRSNVRRLNELARLDPLTGVLNGRAFHNEGRRYFEQARRSGKPLSLAYLDVDNFKSINDSCGHQGGDTILRAVANLLAGAVRTEDIVARMGGDEFALLFPETGIDDAKIILERLTVRMHHLTLENGPSATLSVGIVTFLSMPAGLDDAVQLADGLMYEVKTHGKGRVRAGVWQDGQMQYLPWRDSRSERIDA